MLEHYNTAEKAKELATTLGYASSLYETIEKSHEDRANTDEAIVYESYLDFEDYIRESSFLEYVYIWVEHRNEWQVATWEHTKLDTISDEGLEFRYDWNGFGKLTDVFTNEALRPKWDFWTKCFISHLLEISLENPIRNSAHWGSRTD